MEQAPPKPEPPRSTRIDIRILDDGRVVFGDLPPELAEVAAILGGGEPEVSVDIQALSQALWGQPSLRTLRRAGRVAVHDERAFAFLEAAFPPACVHCWDDF